MSNPRLRLVPETVCDEVSPIAVRRPSAQLTLFDLRPVQRLSCLPMVDLHGDAFTRILGRLRPVVVLDMRSYPYFDLTSLDRQRAFRIFARIPARYVHRPLDLRPPADQGARWRLRRGALDVLTSLDEASDPGGYRLAVLLDRKDEVCVLDEAVRHSEADRPMNWRVECPEGVAASFDG